MKKRAPKIKRKGYAAGGDTSDLSGLTADQLAQYNSMVGDDQKAQYLQSVQGIGKFGNPATSMGQMFNKVPTASMVAGALLKPAPLDLDRDPSVNQATETDALGAGEASGIFTGLGSGMKTGAKIGSKAGPVGAVLGGAAGAVGGALIGGIQGRQNAEYNKNAVERAYATKMFNERNSAFKPNPAQDASGVIQLKDGGEVDDHIESMNNDHLASRIKEIGREKALKEYNDFFNEKKGRYSIKKKS